MLPVIVLISLGIVLHLQPIQAAGQVCSKCSLSTTDQEYCDEDDSGNTLECGSIYGDDLPAFCVNMFSDGQDHKPSMRMCFSEIALKRILNKTTIEDGCYTLPLDSGAWQVCLCRGDTHCNKYNVTEMGQIATFKKKGQLSQMESVKRVFENRYQLGQSKMKEAKKAKLQHSAAVTSGIHTPTERSVVKNGDRQESFKDTETKTTRGNVVEAPKSATKIH